MLAALPLTTPRTEAIRRARLVDPRTLDLLANSYLAIEGYAALLHLIRDGDPSEALVERQVALVAALCREDGADHGFIPLIGGEPREVWRALCSAFSADEPRPLARIVAPLPLGPIDALRQRRAALSRRVVASQRRLAAYVADPASGRASGLLDLERGFLAALDDECRAYRDVREAELCSGYHYDADSLHALLVLAMTAIRAAEDSGDVGELAGVLDRIAATLAGEVRAGAAAV